MGVCRCVGGAGVCEGVCRYVGVGVGVCGGVCRYVGVGVWECVQVCGIWDAVHNCPLLHK